MVIGSVLSASRAVTLTLVAGPALHLYRSVPTILFACHQPPQSIVIFLRFVLGQLIDVLTVAFSHEFLSHALWNADGAITFRRGVHRSVLRFRFHRHGLKHHHQKDFLILLLQLLPDISNRRCYGRRHIRHAGTFWEQLRQGGNLP